MRRSVAAVILAVLLLCVPLAGCQKVGEKKGAVLYTVTFDPGGAPGEVETQAVEDGGFALEPEEPRWDGYQFIGWFTQEGTQWAFSADTVTADCTLYARWVEQGDVVYRYVYFYRSGSPAVAVADGKAVARPQDPTRDGFRFGGWYLDPACTTSYDFAAPVVRNLVLYSKWSKEEIAHYYYVPIVSGTPDYSKAVDMPFNRQQPVFDEYVCTMPETLTCDDIGAGMPFIIADANAPEKVKRRYPQTGEFLLKTTGLFTLYFSYENDYGGGAAFSAALRPHASDADTVTVYFTDNTFTSGKAYAYCYAEAGGENAAWPGMPMSFVRQSSSKKNIYSFTVPAGKYDYILFNDGASGGKTPKIALAGRSSGNAFYLENGAVKEYNYVW